MTTPHPFLTRNLRHGRAEALQDQDGVEQVGLLGMDGIGQRLLGGEAQGVDGQGRAAQRLDTERRRREFWIGRYRHGVPLSIMNAAQSTAANGDGVAVDGPEPR